MEASKREKIWTLFLLLVTLGPLFFCNNWKIGVIVAAGGFHLSALIWWLLVRPSQNQELKELDKKTETKCRKAFGYE